MPNHPNNAHINSKFMGIFSPPRIWHLGELSGVLMSLNILQSQTNKDNNFPKPFQDVRQMLRLHFKVSKQYLGDPMDRSLLANF